MRLLTAILVLLVVLVQYRLWFGDGGVPELVRIERAIASQRAENERLAERNRLLAAEVADLKEGVAAIEERARRELGWIGEGETFYQIVDRAALQAR